MKKKNVTQPHTVVALRRRLNSLPPGKLEGEPATRILSLVTAAWNDLDGPEEAAAYADALPPWENPRWEQGMLRFELEHDGSYVMSRTWMELEHWGICPLFGRAMLFDIRRRQRAPMAPAFDAKQAALTCWNCLQNQTEHAGLRWLKDGNRVHIKFAGWIPTGYQQTTAGRKSRFKRELATLVGENGWILERLRSQWLARRSQESTDVAPEMAG